MTAILDRRLDRDLRSVQQGLGRKSSGDNAGNDEENAERDS